jgi:hypothetical protein
LLLIFATHIFIVFGLSLYRRFTVKNCLLLFRRNNIVDTSAPPARRGTSFGRARFIRIKVSGDSFMLLHPFIIISMPGK